MDAKPGGAGCDGQAWFRQVTECGGESKRGWGMMPSDRTSMLILGLAPIGGPQKFK